MGVSLVKFVCQFFGYMTNILINQHFSTQKLYQNGLFIKWFFDGRPFSTFSPLIVALGVTVDIFYGLVFVRLTLWVTIHPDLAYPAHVFVYLYAVFFKL